MSRILKEKSVMALKSIVETRAARNDQRFVDYAETCFGVCLALAESLPSQPVHLRSRLEQWAEAHWKVGLAALRASEGDSGVLAKLPVSPSPDEAMAALAVPVVRENAEFDGTALVISA